MTKSQNPPAEKAYKQISFGRDFVAEVTLAANAADRSAAKHIEHCFRLAQAIEQILPSSTVQALKAGDMPAPELLVGLATVLANPGQSTAMRAIMKANQVRFSQDPADPDGVIRCNADGSATQGRLESQGRLVPRAASKQKSKG